MNYFIYFTSTYILLTVYAPILAGLSTWEKASKISGVLRFSVEVTAPFFIDNVNARLLSAAEVENRKSRDKAD